MVLGETPELDGNLSTTVRDIYALSQAASLSLPSLRPVKQVSLDTTLKGAIDELLFNNLSVQTAGPSLKTSYDGMLSLADAGNIEGRLEIESSQFRDLLSDIGFAGLPESSQLKSGSISGRATGTFSNLGLKDGRIVIDDTIVTGDISTDLSGRKPSIVADLNTTMVDLTPFIGTKSEASSSTRWSEAPLELAVLEVINARIDLRADGIRVGNINLQNAEVAAALDDGRLNARFEQFSAFGGDWQGLATVDASTDVPSFSFDLSANRVEAQTLLSTLAQFDRLSGAGAFSINVSSSGGTIRQMVNALEGNLSLDLDDGALRGLNLGQLVRSAGSLSEAISTGSLTLRTLGNVVSPQAETDFTTFSASLSVEQGLAQIQSLSLVNPVLAVSGAGQINLGGQTLDVRLTPAIDKSGQGNTTAVQLNGIPVPLRIQGNWMSPKFSPDVSGLQQALTATARERASSELKERIGGEFGSIIADAVGGKHPQSASESVEPSSDEGSENVSQAPPPADETNNNSDTDTTESQTPPKDDRPANVRDALDRILNPD